DRLTAPGAGSGRAGELGRRAEHLRGPSESFPAVAGHMAAGSRLHAVRAANHLRTTMNILISNDDGILARGLAVLGQVCAALGQVTVVAPDREQSGTSHSLTLHRPLHATRRPDGAFQVE